MSWFEKLHQTYECCRDLQERESSGAELQPVGHTSQQVHIVVRVDAQGEFLDAHFAPGGKMQIIIPATEDSASRSGIKPPPHPLADKIQYCAKDYVGTRPNFFAEYEKLLGDWAASEFSHPKIRAVHAYVRKGTLVRDLIGAGLLQADAQGRLLTDAPEEDPSPLFKWLAPKKAAGKTVRDQGEALVCWSVSTPGDVCPETWLDPDIREAWIQFDASCMQKRDLCMITGVEQPVTAKHPKFIRRPGDQAKLVSGNDAAGFTFRGRFSVPGEACGVGYVVSQKAHSALRWLIERQGHRSGDQAVVAWAVGGARVISPEEDGWMGEGLFAPAEEEADLLGGKDQTRDLGARFARQLRSALKGYAATLADHEEVNILGLDSATPGRISIIFYREILWPHYLERLEQWQLNFAWPLRRMIREEVNGKEKSRTITRVGAPLPREICLAAYGARADKKLENAVRERVLPCITDKAPMPRDLVESAVHRASNRAGLEHWEWESTLAVACALLRGYHSDRHPRQEQRRNYEMTLQEDITRRDYLFGRLLAVAEHMEARALYMTKEDRPTNAERLFQRFADRPLSTWRILRMQLEPYRQRLHQRKGFLRAMDTLLDTIHDAFEPADFASDDKLSGEFLLGYHCQRRALWEWKGPAVDDTNQDDQEGA